MKKSLISLAILTSALFVSSSSFAKCVSGNNWKSSSKKVYVCVKGDSWNDRKKARSICSKVTRSSCGPVSTSSSSCSGGACYDANGKKHYSLSGY